MRPNFTGVWRLIPEKCEFAFLPPPRRRVDTIVHDDPQLRIHTHQIDANGDIALDRDLTIGGQAITIAIRGRERQIRAFWDGDVLVLETLSMVSGSVRRLEDRRSLDTAAEWLTIERLHAQPGGPVKQVLRFHR
jgi:hypothetical protein